MCDIDVINPGACFRISKSRADKNIAPSPVLGALWAGQTWVPAVPRGIIRAGDLTEKGIITFRYTYIRLFAAYFPDPGPYITQGNMHIYPVQTVALKLR